MNGFLRRLSPGKRAERLGCGCHSSQRGGAAEGKEAMRGVVKALLSDEPEERGCRPAEGCAVLINVGVLSHWRGRG